ncbi:MAG: AmmeMemoRadiSam system protein B [Candidatus Thermoplasmatota archaeon]|jgi:AmmeMemoRadiSam system protein B|nr:AmmeMemoRadiSam system protein B [Candidatus Thermoplasmatota archaeon]
MPNIRRSFSEGYLYPAERSEMERTLTDLDVSLPGAERLGELISILLPHGNLKNCGDLILQGLKQVDLNRFKNLVIVGTNHKKTNQPISYCEGISFKFYDEIVEINQDLLEGIKSNPWLIKDNLIHEQEYSIDVFLPYLRHLTGENFSIIPIMVSKHTVEESRNLASTFGMLKNEALPVISSNLNQYEDRNTTITKDDEIIKSFLSLDTAEFFKTAKEIGHTSCNLAGMGGMMEITRKLNGRIKIIARKTLCYNSNGIERCTGYITAVSSM